MGTDFYEMLGHLDKKVVLTSKEAALYIGVSPRYIYQLIFHRKIPCYKSPTGRCYFNKNELEEWMQSSRVSTDEEIGQKSQEYCIRNKD